MANSNSDNISDFNEDELHSPVWLNKEFLEMVLKQHENNENLEIESYVITPGTGKSDHYASVMFRAKINYGIKTPNGCNQKFTSWIIKTTPEKEGMKMDMLQEFSLFKTEILMYAEILPKIDKILKSTGYQKQFYAKMIYSSTIPRECIIFEDLVEKGYTVVSKRDCTMNEVNVALDKLARLHAISYKMIQEGDTKIPTLASFFNKAVFDKFDFMREGMINLKNILSKTDDLRMYVKHLENVEKNLEDEVVAYFDPKTIVKHGGILVLNHGDFHSRNIMVQYKDDAFTDVMLVDFQICFYGSPVLDLMYASVLMLAPEMRIKHRDEIFSKYIDVFQTTLKQLNFSGNIPTKSDFDVEWKRCKRWELLLHINYLIFTYAIAEGKIPLADLVEKPEARHEIWHNEKFVDEMRIHLPRLLKIGAFD